MRETYKASWAVLLLGVASLLILGAFFWSLVIALVALMTGGHALWMLNKHSRIIKGWTPTIIGMFLALLALSIQVAIWRATP